MIQGIDHNSEKKESETYSLFFGFGMAARKYQGSSSSSFSLCKYQVFLSFRGEDTRKNFTDHLYAALFQAGIHTFRDDDGIRRGENIDLEIQKAIQQSKLSIIVFSKDYASSRWCLDELVMIMQRRTAGCIVLPVFYHVDPSQVGEQTGSFATAFVEHEKHLQYEMERVNGWRVALKEVADLAGMVLGDGYEAQFVQSIVDKVSKKLDRRIFHAPLHFIGRDSMINYINSWLQDGSHGAAIALLCGIGGVGKTAIAKRVYNQNFDKFEGRSFLANVRERSNETNGLVCLQRQLLSDILNKTANEIHDIDEGIMKIKDAICCRRTLIVLDNVDNRDQLNAIIGMPNWLCRGSKIIVTTRNKGLVSVHDECVECKIKPLDNKESLELFSWHAFGQAHPIEDFAEHSKRIARHCNGLPLALRIIGSSLSGKGTEVWESAVQEMEAIPNCEVQKVLRVSYDSLDDDYQKNLFLDIACFFNEMDEEYVIKIVDGLGIGARFRIDNLIDRCLVEIHQDKSLWMHQLIRDMGREIARQESPKCERIWQHVEALTLLKETTDAERVRGLALDLHGLREDNTKVVRREDALQNSMVRQERNFFEQYFPPTFLYREWFAQFFSREHPQTGQTSLFPLVGTGSFRKMQSVKFLKLNYMKFVGSYEHFPKNLIWLCWHGFSLRSIPKHFCLEKLVVLDLSRSSLVDVWKGKMSLPKLKILDLRHSQSLIKTPDFSGLPGLEMLILEDCIHLVQIHKSIGDLCNLIILNLRNCKSLVELPEEISRLNSLEELVLDGCSDLDGLNKELKQLQRPRLLYRDGMVASTSYTTTMPLELLFRSWLSMRKNSRFTSFSFPGSLLYLNLNGTPIRFLPESIKGLSTLVWLSLRKCDMLQKLPELPSDLIVLEVAGCHSLQSFTDLPPFINVDRCDQLVQIQDLIELELIQKADLQMLRIMETVSLQMQPSLFEILLLDNVFHILCEENEISTFCPKEDQWLIQNEFQGLQFKMSSPAEHQICGLNLFTRFSATLESAVMSPFFAEIKNNIKVRKKVICPIFLTTVVRNGIYELLCLSHWKCGAEDLEFDNGDEVSVSVYTNEQGVQLKTFGIRILHEEEENDHNIQSNNEVITAPSSSCSWDHQTLGDAHVAKAQIASRIFTNYYCYSRFSVAQVTYISAFYPRNRTAKRT